MTAEPPKLGLPVRRHVESASLHSSRELGTRAGDRSRGTASGASGFATYGFGQLPIHPKPFGHVQPKLTVGSPSDAFEHEADRVADEVMRMPEPSIQRACACEKADPEQRMQQSDEARRRVQTKQASPMSPGPTDAPSIVHGTLSSPGHPLDPATRSFMEPRFGHDFGNVRVHSDDRAAQSARAISALAYTTGNDVVFGRDQYQPRTDRGMRLLAHELTHVIQQNGTRGQTIQRLGDLSRVPPGLACPVATSSAAFVDTNVLFSVNSSALSPTAITDIAAFIGRWNAAGASAAVRVDGYASTEGGDPLNWTLSCDRALAVQRELSTPSSGIAGIPAASLETIANGETSEFGSSLPPNRRVTISANLAAPPPPACANPGVVRTLDLQPIFMRTGPTDRSPTGTSWTRRFNEANAIWNKIGVTFNELTAITLDTPLKTTGATVTEILAIMALRSGSGVEVFLADNDLAGVGGGGTLPGCGAGGKIVISDRGTSDTLLAHELAHTLFNSIDHPPTVGDPGTIATPSGSHSTANPTRNTMVNFGFITCPAGSGSTCLNPDV